MRSDPFKQFAEWFGQAEKAGQKEPTAMALATCTRDGVPSCRMVLLKEFSERGFVFYTNLESRKGLELAQNPRAALCFHWQKTGCQVRIEGRTEAVGQEEADAYFQSRPRQSRIGAWASRQSRPLSGMAVLLADAAKIAVRYGAGEIPRPPHWSGFRVVPDRIEFWQEGEFRLHERTVFTRVEKGWSTEKLYP